MNGESAGVRWQNKLRLWTRNRWLRKYQWQFSPIYWKLRDLKERSRFQLARHLYSARTDITDARTASSIFAIIARSALSKIIVAVLILLGTASVERYSANHWQQVLSLALVQFLTRKLPPLHFDANAYTSLFSTLAGVAGVFIGLYFTAVSTLASSVYARVPADIRSLLVADKMSNVYIKLVAYLGVFSLLLLGMQAIGWPAGMLTISVITLLGVLSLLSFVKLGMRTFNFYDPPSLAEYALTELSRSMLAASPSGPHWRDPAFQAAYQRNAEQSADTFSSLVQISTNSQYQHLRGQSLTSMARTTLRMMRYYCNIKSNIPSDSAWFRAEIKQANWLTTNQMNVDIAVKTGTSLNPEVVKDFHWIERAISSAVGDLLKCLLVRNHNNDATEATQMMVATTKHLAQNWMIEDAMLLQTCLSSVATSHAYSMAISKQPKDEEIRATQVALSFLDSSAMGVLNIMLGLAHYLASFRADHFRETIKSIRWQAPKDIYKHHLPRPVIEQIEWLVKRIRFEQACEGVSRTPLWYTSQIASLGLVRSLLSTVALAVERLNLDIQRPAEKFLAEGKIAFAAHLVSRGLEACNKASFMLDCSEQFYKELSELRKATDIPWVKYDAVAMREKVSKTRLSLIGLLAKLAPILAATPPTDKLPDYFGQAYVVLAEETFRALAGGDDTQFASIFEAIVTLGVLAPDRLAESLKDQQDRTRTIFQTEPIADLFDLSGYALLYGELYGKDLWKTATAVWDKFLGQLHDTKKACRYLASVAIYRQSIFGISPRDIIRTEWEMTLSRNLSEKGILGSYDTFPPDRSHKHSSKFINSLGSTDFLAYHAKDYFFAEYLFRRPEVEGMPMPHRIKDLIKRLAKLQDIGNHTNVEDIEDEEEDDS